MVWVGLDLTTPTHLPADARPLCSMPSWMACQTTSDTTTRGWYGCGLLPDAVHGEMQRSVLSCTPLMSLRFSTTSTAGGRRTLHPSRAASNRRPCPTESNHPQAPAWCGLSNNRHTSFISAPFAPTWSLDDVPEPDRAWGDHGRIGATAALAWPAKVATWEAIAWRPPLTTDQPRRVDGRALEAVDGWPGTFLSRDPRNGTGLIAPRGRSPVLFGLRATTKSSAEEGCRHLLAASGTEPASGWRVFRSNQASGDHLDEPYRLTVERVEVHNQRKHAVVFTDGPSVKAYAEGGPVNALARWLAPGDVVLVHGLEHEGFVHAERLKVDAWMPRAQQRPTCATCKVRMKSMGAGQGVRCPRCKQRAPDTWEPVAAAPPFPSWVEPPASARRHLARPLAWDEQL